MAKKSAIEKNKARIKLAGKYLAKRNRLKAIASDKSIGPEERFAARLKLAELPRNSAPGRLRNRCGITGRPRGYLRFFGLSRIAVRDLALKGQLPGVRKGNH